MRRLAKVIGNKIYGSIMKAVFENADEPFSQVFSVHATSGGGAQGLVFKFNKMNRLKKKHVPIL
jgi:hypothetical protein